MMANRVTQHTPCLSIYVRHHEVEGIGPILLNMVKRINMALINVKVGIGRKFRWVMPS